MADITVSGRKIQVTDALRSYATEKISNALKVFNIEPMTCDIILRVDRNRSNPDRKTVEVTVHVRDSVVRASESDPDMYAAIDLAAEKVERQLRKYKTRIIDKRQHRQKVHKLTSAEDLDKLIEPKNDDDDLLVREKTVKLIPMSEDKALVETDLLGHDFYMFLNANSGQINVIYHRKNGGYGILKPEIEDVDEQ
ncbi:MAG: ribosome-associated translation inhibitor RaiA [Coriobacteriaceae bacterium]|jgi:putative sigma-54 modulation protein|uniref:ribosome hibernation-promoting factor, HPF/YfiA family n=1 Tax=Atopobium sp. oral taxon 416 TaxID=712157 RepID=UPI000FF2C00E|nr:ribosome-associated translation inhibitor RaiA [Atopobium sp. oral taxon 416]QUC03969.1 ribosome-associated translation inhibitor RaiA [Atopobium sp. oral taxon 416]RRF99814.1 MAG: ribosome-associated translation inhibitor RaiA [Coriobacteriaceae bacterium]